MRDKTYVFFGTSSFSVAILEKLMSDFFYPSFIVCQPDKPVGRKQVMTSPPIVEVCKDHNLDYVQPEKVKEILPRLQELQPDYIITASYGQIIPKEVLETAKHGAINVHTSLLPKYRGASPVQSAILEGDKETGITIMLMDEKMDHGPMIFKYAVPIEHTDTAESLLAKLAYQGADVLTKVLPDFLKGKMKPQEQNHDEATFCPIIKKDHARIDWAKSAEEIERMTRAYFPWPIAWTMTPDEKRLKLFPHIEVVESPKPNADAGTMIMEGNELYIACINKKALHMQSLQLESKQQMSTEDFVRGYSKYNNSTCK